MSTVTQEKDYGHVPVLLHECLDALAIKPDGIYVDGTLGRAGHSLEIVKRLTTGRLIGIDRDETAIAAAQERLADYGDRVTLVHSNFDRIGDILAERHAVRPGCVVPAAGRCGAGLQLYARRAAGHADGSDGVSHRPGGGEQLEL